MSETEAEYQARLTAWKKSYGKGPRPVRKVVLLDSARNYYVKGLAPTDSWIKAKNAEYNRVDKERIERKLRESGG